MNEGSAEWEANRDPQYEFTNPQAAVDYIRTRQFTADQSLDPKEANKREQEMLELLQRQVL